MSLAGAFTPKRPLVLCGAGKMGSAMLTGWLDAGLDPSSVIAIDPAPPPDIAKTLKAAGVTHATAIPQGVTARFVVIAVKPQLLGDVLPSLTPLFGRHTITLSIAAGATLGNLDNGLGGGRAVIRAMPNTPAQIGRGITAGIANSKVSAAGRKLADALLAAVGQVVWLEKESDMDAVTAVSGSGPAYVFLLAETMARAGKAAGLDEALAAKLARATVAGAGELLGRSDVSAEQLRKNVTSPKGTTAAALDVLMSKDGIAGPMKKAVAAAKKRSKQLSG